MSSGYETDFAAWAVAQALAAREGRLHDLGLGNVADELEGLVARERSEIRRHLADLLIALRR